MTDEYDPPHPILGAIVEAKQEGRDHLTREEFEKAFEDDPETRDYVVERLNEEAEKDSTEDSKSVMKRIKAWILQ